MPSKDQIEAGPSAIFGGGTEYRISRETTSTRTVNNPNATNITEGNVDSGTLAFRVLSAPGPLGVPVGVCLLGGLLTAVLVVR